MSEDRNGLVGLSESEATERIKAVGMRARIMWKDGQAHEGTCDARSDRVNLHIKDGKVIKAYIG
ncbi:MAG: hypothetical protein A3H69_04260 [Candidatus Sungbacteria bacterium RIFCSPLOWO2_02_FULL_47_9]|uniref:Uncharacterized protein n=1 Tax=Candidatus Sungbacteria bacterium RIFCSPHIGHO2_01_FULL_47_32 TaxID=1802264 RepID=A0A1G2K8V9_9BACT|nr:MAG: hypothetical protein A2633_04855 [Candidatus Sungbacteria bacterium RIFCSPHIGHO2_01_FULL_47_32]OGZ99483.1 MAG: hypothetical protein A3D57_02200 [Candidatus Sungbacteria bacterium RIFCSPHIGHO2_02_FULL_46_12]OHA05370.1 MAG: hypothetical protein A3A28_01920 [Candidatus Sungbacteria bacterium RIFCSPLOWO2_01_FULL_47_32]OHA10888.1 MAG: hypothetical protein A3H69_04260 [Candidatus Sungbacteria bacterium RIFCSPLOWO2_02_FULL_47_9]